MQGGELFRTTFATYPFQDLVETLGGKILQPLYGVSLCTRSGSPGGPYAGAHLRDAEIFSVYVEEKFLK